MAMIDLSARRLYDGRAKLTRAIELQRKALAFNPANPAYRKFLADHLRNLITAHRALGDPDGVSKAERELAEVRDADPAMVAVDARLLVIIKGDQQPKDEAERLQLAQRACDKAIHVTATKLWSDALQANPKLIDDRQAAYRYNAACAAALAASGAGKDDPPPDDTAKAKLRRQALDWLKAELAIWVKLLESGPLQAKASIAQTLKHWQADTDLAGIRDAKALGALPESERAAWRTLWSDVAALLEKARAATEPAK
jgi:hypothetical protein